MDMWFDENRMGAFVLIDPATSMALAVITLNRRSMRRGHAHHVPNAAAATMRTVRTYETRHRIYSSPHPHARLLELATSPEKLSIETFRVPEP